MYSPCERLFLSAEWKTNSIIHLFQERTCQLFLSSWVQQCSYFSSLLIGDEKSSEPWVQAERELLFRRCNIHDVSCGTSTVELHNPRAVSGALKTTFTPKRLCCCLWTRGKSHKPPALVLTASFKCHLWSQKPLFHVIEPSIQNLICVTPRQI